MASNNAGSGPPHGVIKKFVQDGPPPGGYAPVSVKRNLPKSGPSSIVLASGSFFLFTYGMYKIIRHNGLRREWKREEMDIRLSILPFLQAEQDVQSEFFKGKYKEQEAEIMKGVPDWDVDASCYHTKYMPPMEIRGLGAKFPWSWV